MSKEIKTIKTPQMILEITQNKDKVFKCLQYEKFNNKHKWAKVQGNNIYLFDDPFKKHIKKNDVVIGFVLSGCLDYDWVEEIQWVEAPFDICFKKLIYEDKEIKYKHNGDEIYYYTEFHYNLKGDIVYSFDKKSIKHGRWFYKNE